jgi:hypothetical protein
MVMFLYHFLDAQNFALHIFQIDFQSGFHPCLTQPIFSKPSMDTTAQDQVLVNKLGEFRSVRKIRDADTENK